MVKYNTSITSVQTAQITILKNGININANKDSRVVDLSKQVLSTDQVWLILE